MNTKPAPHDDIRVRIGLRIATLRAERKISQRKLALIVEMDRVTLNRIEAGKGNPTLLTLERIAEGLGVSLDEILAP